MGRLALSIQDMKMRQLKIILRYRITPKLVVYMFMKHNKLPPPIRIGSSIHPLNRAKEWGGRTGRIQYDVVPTIVANEYRSCGNVIYNIYETE